MRSLAALILLASPLAACAAEPALLPTIPQIPPPVVHQEGGTIVQVGWGERALPPASAQPCEGCATRVGPVERRGGGCGASICPGSPIKKWLCFHPTTGHALPWLKPAPYVGPITGQFPCTSNNGPGCAGGAVGSDPDGTVEGGVRGHGGSGLFRRGCNGNGTCTPPADDAFAGYKFATVSPRLLTPGNSAPASGSYRPASSSTGISPPASTTRTPTVLESLKRAFAKQ